MFINGQHRVQAMRDAYLTHTFVVEHEEIPQRPATGTATQACSCWQGGAYRMPNADRHGDIGVRSV
jgi:hypothetical protein